MTRDFQPLVCGLLLSVVLLGCGPDKKRCTGPHPDFVVLIELSHRPLPLDTVVRITYGGSSMEHFALVNDGLHESLFCRVATADGGVPPAAETDAGGSSVPPVDALSCELWTAGYAKIEVTSSAAPVFNYDLAPRSEECTVTKTLTLDGPDAG